MCRFGQFLSVKIFLQLVSHLLVLERSAKDSPYKHVHVGNKVNSCYETKPSVKDVDKHVNFILFGNSCSKQG